MSIHSETELNAIGVLKRRTIEAKVLGPVIEAMAAEFGRERVLEVARRVISGIAREQGAALAAAAGGDSIAQFAGTLDRWTADDALRIEVVEQSAEAFGYNVTRCRYAEMYRELGIPELGAVLSCQRDGALIEGFNPSVQLTRTQTLMGGASHCDFRYRLQRPNATAE
ncbi:MAG: L-2-amino-thiazoline-4-carboxylic acid hydrolase [Gemmatimonadetes bacterium]|nr:L-2-amino-thiazoline-4-carboxylic acid hydrolase [Gemmatimonadota bacterium]